MLDEYTLRHLPKVLLHDHLDGGLRPETLVELAAERGYRRLPTTNPRMLTDWLRGGGQTSVDKVLWAYGHMTAVMQTVPDIERVAREAAADLVRDNVIYAELRMAPSEHTFGGLSAEEALQAAIRGLEAGSGDRGVMRVIVTAMRNRGDSDRIADLASDHRDRGVVGFDLAGPEVGYPNSDHLSAIGRARHGGLSISLHAGDEGSIDGITDAIDVCGATRIGVAYQMGTDVSILSDGTIDLGPRGRAIHDARIHLEMCPTAGLRMHSIRPEQHPVGALHRAGFSISLNTDSRLLCGDDMTNEFDLVVRHHGFTAADLREVTLAALDAAFCDDAAKAELRVKIEDGFMGV